MNRITTKAGLLCFSAALIAAVFISHSLSNSPILDLAVTVDDDAAASAHQQGGLHHPNQFNFFFLSDIHVEPFYNPAGILLTEFGDMECRRPDCVGPDHVCATDFSREDTADMMPLVGCDGPITLFESALQRMQAVEPRPNIIVLGGDLVAHYLYDVPTRTAVQKAVLQRISAAFPGVPVVCAVGNNDLHQQIVSPEEMARLWSIWSAPDAPTRPTLLNGASADDDYYFGDEGDDDPLSTSRAQATFLDGGYYSYRARDIGVRFVMLNSLIFSPPPRYQVTVPGGSTWLAIRQMEWLEREVDHAYDVGEIVVVVGHVPPGMYYNKDDWLPEYTESFVRILSKYKGTVQVMDAAPAATGGGGGGDSTKTDFDTPPLYSLHLFGHHSKEMFRSLSIEVAAFISLGLTPAGGHAQNGEARDSVNPGFSHLSFVDGMLKDLQTHHLDMSSLIASPQVRLWAEMTATTTPQEGTAQPLMVAGGSGGGSGGGGARLDAVAAMKDSWKAMYSFADTYGTTDLSGPSLRAVALNMRFDSVLRSRYMSLTRGLYVDDPWNSCDSGVSGRTEEVDCVTLRCRFDAGPSCSAAITLMSHPPPPAAS